MKRIVVVLSVAVAFGLAASACAGQGSDLATARDDTADTYLSPVYATSAAAIAELAASTTKMCDDPERSSDIARDEWMNAETTWMATQAGWFGPTTMDRADSEIGYQPTSETGIEETLDSDHVINAAFVRDSLPTTQKGLGAIEYILFSGVPIDSRRCEYLDAVATVVAEEADALNTAWKDSWNGGPSYVDHFKGSGEMGLTSRDALGLSTAGILELTKKLTLEQIGKALGISSPEPHPEAYPEGRAEFGLGALRSQVAGIATAYGTEPNSMSGAVSSRDEGVDEIIQNALSDALELIDAIVTDSESTSFTSALATNRADLEDLYELMAVLRRTFETDVVSLLDVTLGFSDSDGDSG